MPKDIYKEVTVAQRTINKREGVKCSFKDCTFKGKTKKQTKEHEISEHGAHKIKCPDATCTFESTTADMFAKHYQTEHGLGTTAPVRRRTVEKKQHQSKVKTEKHLPIPGFPRRWTSSSADSTLKSPMASYDGDDDSFLPSSSSLFGESDPPSRARRHDLGSADNGPGESSSKKSKLSSYAHPTPIFSGIRDWGCMSVYIDGKRGYA